MSHDRQEQWKDASDGSLSPVAHSKVFLGRCWQGCSGWTCCWRGWEKVTAWSVTTTEQTGHFELPPRHRPQKERPLNGTAFILLLWDGSKALPVRSALIFCLADWSLKATEVKGEQGARWPGVGTTRRDVYSLLCSLRECDQPPLQPPGVGTAVEGGACVACWNCKDQWVQISFTKSRTKENS